MKNNPLTTSEIRRHNRSLIYKAIYQNQQISKQGLAQLLQLSLPTINQNLTELLEEGLIEIFGVSQSTGGRKAQLYRCVSDARIALGVSILEDNLKIVAIDLNGTILFREQYTLSFEDNPAYFQKICDWIQDFIQRYALVQEHILGIGIAIQGLISPDGKRVVFGKLLHNDHVTLDDFAEHLDYPCILLHDAKTAASCEFWNHPNLKDTAFLLLNKNLGGALFLNGKIHTGPMMTSGIFEHMCLVPNGKPCYCGQRGCLDAYCSAGSLADEAQMSLDEFFVSVRSGSAREVQIWDTYLHNLATAINNILLVVNCDIILGGLLSQYLRPEDLEALHRYAKEKSAFDFPNSYFFSKSKTNAYVEATGAALYYIEDFLKEL